MQFRVKDFYNEVLNSGIITFGKKALDHAEKLYLIPYIGNIIHRTDKFGMLGEVLKIRERNKKLSKSCDNLQLSKGPNVLKVDFQAHFL